MRQQQQYQRIMFEILIAKVLNKVLGDFIQNIDPAQLNISVMQGDVNLSNMKLRQDIFESLPLPFALDYGQIGNIRLKIPIWNMFSSPLVIEISEILAVIRPKHIREWSEEAEVSAYKSANRRKIEQYEIIQENIDRVISKDPSEVDKLVTKIIDNIEISIRNIYVRYEDSQSSPIQGRFVVGVLLRELVTHTTGLDWARKIMSLGEDITFKVVRLRDFMVFMDYEAPEAKSSPFLVFGGTSQEKKVAQQTSQNFNLEELLTDRSNRRFIEVIKNEFENKNILSHKYLIDSFSMEARLRLNKNIENNMDPKYEVQIVLGGLFEQDSQNISLKLHQPQIVRIVKLAEYIGYFRDFQYGSVESLKLKVIDHETAFHYVNLYSEWKEKSMIISNSLDDSLVNKVKAKVRLQYLEQSMSSIESEYPNEQIISLRIFSSKIIQSNLDNKRQKDNIDAIVREKRNNLTKWGGLFTSREEELANDKEIFEFRKSLESEKGEQFCEERAVLSEELQKIVAKFGKIDIGKVVEESKQQPQSQPQMVNGIKLSVSVPRLTFLFINEFDQGILTLSVTHQQASLSLDHQLLILEFKMGSFVCIDLWTGAKIFENIIETREFLNEGDVIDEETDQFNVSGKNALSIQLQVDMMSMNTPIKLRVSSERTLFLITSFTLIKEIVRTIECAVKDQDIDIEYYQEAATEKAIEYMNAGKEIFENIKKGRYQHGALDLSVFLQAPMILIPENIFDANKPCLLIDAGFIQLQSHLLDKQQLRTKDLKSEKLASFLYDRYEATFQDFQINLLENGVPFGIDSIARGCGHQVVKKLNLQLQFFNCLEPMHPEFPTAELTFIVKTFEIQIGLGILHNILRIQSALQQQLDGTEEVIFQQKQTRRARKESYQDPMDIAVWEQLRLSNRKRALKELKQDVRPGQIDDNQIQFEEFKEVVGKSTCFKIYCSIEKLNIRLYRFNISLKRDENLLNAVMLNFGVEVELDRFQNTHVSINIYSFLLDDIHKLSRIADPFRMILSSSMPNAQKQFRHNSSILKNSLITLIEKEQHKQLNFQSQLEGQSRNQLEVKIGIRQNETKVNVLLSDIRLIITLPTVQKLIQLSLDLQKTINILQEEVQLKRQAKLKMYEYVLSRLNRPGASANEEQNYVTRLFKNFAEENELNQNTTFLLIREGVQKLKTIWSLRKNEQKVVSQKQDSNGFPRQKPRKFSLIQNAADNLIKRKDIVKSKLKIYANLNLFSIWIPLYAGRENTQALSLSYMSELTFNQNMTKENTVDAVRKAILTSEILESHAQVSFGISQLSVQMVETNDFTQLFSHYSRLQPIQKHRKSSICEDSSLSSNSEDLPLLKSSTIIPPCRIGMALDLDSRTKDVTKTVLSLIVEPIQIQIGFKQIDFGSILSKKVMKMIQQELGVNSKIEEQKGKFDIKEDTIHKPKTNQFNSQDLKKVQEVRVKIHCDSIVFSLDDDSRVQSIPLVQAELKSISSSIDIFIRKDDAGTYILKKMGIWNIRHQGQSSKFLDANASMQICLNYFNPRSLNSEPLLEKWDFSIILNQTAPYTQLSVSLVSQKILNINLTFGMALNLRHIMDRLKLSLSKEALEDVDQMSAEFIQIQEIQENDRPDENFDAGYIFQNNLGIDLKIALHDEFCDDNLESTLFNLDNDGKRKSALRRSISQERHQQQIFKLSKENTLHKSYRELSELQRRGKAFRSGGLFVETLEEDPIRIDMKVQGFQKISAIPIEGLGVYSYKAKIVQALALDQLRKPIFSQAKGNRTIGVLLNFQMEGTQKVVSIESQVLMMNNSKHSVQIFVKTALQDESEIRNDQHQVIESGNAFQVPLAWLVSELKISMFIKTDFGSQLIFKNLVKTFSPKQESSRLSPSSSKIIKLKTDFYTSLDVHAYNCLPKSTKLMNPPQYVISFNQPMMISNYNFIPLELKMLSPSTQTISQIGPKETQYVSEIDGIAGMANLQWTIYDQPESRYVLVTPHFNLNNRLQQGSCSEKFKLEKRKIKLQMEVRKIRNLSNNRGYNENFELREKFFEFASSFHIMLYPRYMVVNQTPMLLQCEQQEFESYSNNYFYSKNEKTAFKIPGYKYSESFQIITVGLSGILALDIEQKEDVQIDRLYQREYIPQRLEFGITISQASIPFNQTIIITIAPRYVVINKLLTPLVLKQKGQKSQVLMKDHQINFSFESRKERLLMIREPSREELIGLTYGQKLYKDMANDEKKFWSSYFSLDDVDDFQVCYPQHGSIAQSPLLDNVSPPWYNAQQSNNFRQYVRVIVRSQNEATIQIVFTEPSYPEYELVNKTKEVILFGQVHEDSFLKSLQKLKHNATLEDLIIEDQFQVLQPRACTPFAWPCRTISKKLLGIKLGGSIQEINLEKALCRTEVHSEDGAISYKIEVKVLGNSKQLRIMPSDQVEKEVSLHQTSYLEKLLKRLFGSKLSIEVSLKGIGLSFIDETPQELLYLSIYDLSIQLQKWYESRDDGTKALELNQKLSFSLRHLQLDNMINQTMPVVLAPSKSLIRKDRQNILVESSHQQEQDELREESKGETKSVPLTTGNDLIQSSEGAPFLQIIVCLAESNPLNQSRSTRLRSLQLAIQEFIFQIDTSIINSNMKFVIELVHIFTDKRADVINIASNETFEQSKYLSRDAICPDLIAKPSEVILTDEIGNKSNANKMYIDLIHLGAIKALITFKLEKRAVEFDSSDPTRVFGIANLLYTLIAAMASISQTPITFKELILIDSFATTNSLITQLKMNYVRQGIMQFYKLLGSSDMIGNPLGLINKLGTGVFELISEPTKGLLKGPDEFVGGVGKGVQSLVSNVISGSFESFSKITGSLYTVVKTVSGDKNATIRKADHIGEGIYYGVKGGMKELVYGVSGLVTKPIQKTREEGAKGFFKGLGSGIVGAITAPVTATLRVGTSLTQGVAASASSLGKIGKGAFDTNSIYSRFRPPRYINARNVITEFNEDLALVRQILRSKYLGKYGGESIKYFTLLPLTRKNGDIQNINSAASILIITESMLLYFKLETSKKKKGRPHRLFKTRLRKIQHCELYKVSNLGKRKFAAQMMFNIVITSYSQVQGQKKFALASPDYSRLELIYKLLSVQAIMYHCIYRLPFCEAVDRFKKQRNSKIVSALEEAF